MSDILTAEQLDALPEGTPIIDLYSDISTKQDGLWHSYETTPMPSAKVAKWKPRLATAEEVVAKLEAILAYQRAAKQRHTPECMSRTRIGFAALDACDCPIPAEGVES